MTMSIRSFVSSVIHHFEQPFKTYNRIEISSSAILGNYDLVQKNSPEVTIWPVLKSNAYGHGIKLVTQILKKRTFPYVVVDSYFEALQIREVSKQPILLIGATHPDNWVHMDLRGIAVVVYDFITLDALGSLRKPVAVHLKINTGMNRQGIRPEDVSLFLDQLQKYPTLSLEGLCSHLADADGERDGFTEKQAEVFDSVIRQVRSRGVHPRYYHLANTAGSAKTTSLAVNAVRLGIGLYGFNPLAPHDPAKTALDTLQPALRFISTIIKTDTVRAGEKVSYNGTYTFDQDGTVGILPVGYYEVFDRRLSNKGVVKYLGNGNRIGNGNSLKQFRTGYLPIRGRVCMNLTVIDTTGVTAKLGDEVEIISNNHADLHSVEAMANLCGTIPYEILVKMNESTRRTVVQ